MPRCQASDHPDCWHDCPDGTTCIAFYERETHLCIRGCNEVLLSVGLVASLARAGWSAKTTADVRQIGMRGIRLAALQVRALATMPQPQPPDNVPLKEIVGLTEEIERRVQKSRDLRVDFQWASAPVLPAFQTILKTLP